MGDYIAFPELFKQSENIISNIGFGLFLFGITLSLEGFKNKNNFSKLEIKRYADLTCILFFNIGNISSHATNEFLLKFKELGYGSLAFGEGGITIVKDKYNRLHVYLKEYP